MPLLHHQLVACFKEMSCGDIITTFLGGLLGFLGAYIMFRIQRKSDRDADAEREATFHRGTFLFVMEQLELAMKGWGRQRDDLLEFSAIYRDDPFQDHQHTVSITPALRSLDSIDRKELRLAIGYSLGDVGGGRVFRSLVAVIDFFVVHGNRTIEAIESIKTDIYREKVRFDDLQAEVGLSVTGTMGILRERYGRDHPNYQKLNNLLQGLHTHINSEAYRENPKDFYDHLIKPCLLLVGDDEFPPSEITNILSAAKRAQQTYRRLTMSSAELAAYAERAAFDINWMLRLSRKVMEIMGRARVQ